MGAEVVLAERPWRLTGVLATLNLSRHVRRLTDPKNSGAVYCWTVRSATPCGQAHEIQVWRAANFGQEHQLPAQDKDFRCQCGQLLR